MTEEYDLELFCQKSRVVILLELTVTWVCYYDECYYGHYYFYYELPLTTITLLPVVGTYRGSSSLNHHHNRHMRAIDFFSPFSPFYHQAKETTVEEAVFLKASLFSATAAIYLSIMIIMVRSIAKKTFAVMLWTLFSSSYGFKQRASHSNPEKKRKRRGNGRKDVKRETILDLKMKVGYGNSEEYGYIECSIFAQ